jgi:hypothetical protein
MSADGFEKLMRLSLGELGGLPRWSFKSGAE